MKTKALIRGVIVLSLVFVAVYTGMSNTHVIDLSFPLLLKQKVSQPAALVMFGMFAIGLLVGIFLAAPAKAVEAGEPEKKKK